MLTFDVNDFDGTLPGPWEWDVKRLAVSMLIAARGNGFGAREQDRIVLDTVGAYRTAMAEFAAMNSLDVSYSRLDIESVLQDYGSQFKPKLVPRSSTVRRGSSTSRRCTRAWIALLLGRDGQEPLFLQMKEAEAPVLEEFPRTERVLKPRRTRGRRPAIDAERHLPRLAARRGRARRQAPATSTPGS